MYKCRNYHKGIIDTTHDKIFHFIYIYNLIIFENIINYLESN